MENVYKPFEVIIENGYLQDEDVVMVENFYQILLSKFELDLRLSKSWVKAVVSMENEEGNIVKLLFSENIPSVLKDRIERCLPSFAPINNLGFRADNDLNGN